MGCTPEENYQGHVKDYHKVYKSLHSSALKVLATGYFRDKVLEWILAKQSSVSNTVPCSKTLGSNLGLQTA